MAATYSILSSIFAAEEPESVRHEVLVEVQQLMEELYLEEAFQESDWFFLTNKFGKFWLIFGSIAHKTKLVGSVK